MKVSELFEDWGSSDWYGPMKEMKELLAAGHSFNEAARDVAYSIHEYLGYDDFEDTVASVKRTFKARNPSVKVEDDENINEGLSTLENAIKLNWMSWSVDRIVRRLKLNIKDGDKEWQFLKGMSDQDLIDLVDNAKDDARNQVDEQIAGKGMWVIKNKDGKERRFKDDESPAAKAWKDSSSPKKPEKVPQYSDAYWERKEEQDPDIVLPWSPIRGDDAAYDQIDAIVKDEFNMKTVDWTFSGKNGEQKRDGTSCAVQAVRVSYEVTPEDDLGVEHITSDSQTIYIARNPKKPSKIEFLKYGN
jgi:hypothetical protein